MITKRFYLPLVATALLTACSQEDVAERKDMGDGLAKAATSSFTSFDEQGETRSVVDPTGLPIAFKWASGDKLAIYSGGEASGMTNFDLVDGINSEVATFKANGFSLTAGAQYYAFTPYNGNETNKKQIAVDYKGQVQAQNGSYSHLGAKDFQYSSATTAISEDPNHLTEFNLSHLGSVCRFQLTVPETGVFTEFTLSGTGLASEGILNLTNGAFTRPVVAEGSISLSLATGSSSGISVNANGVLTLYIMLPKQDLSGKTLTATLTTTGSKKYNAKLAGKNIEGGHAYAWKANVKVPLPVYMGHEYVLIGGKKWATMNLGATTEAGSYASCVGDFYAWGDINPRYTSISWTGSKATFTGISNPYNNTHSPSYTKATLDASHDAVRSNAGWSGNWRMPTDADFLELAKACTGETSNKNLSDLSTSNPTGGIYKIRVDQTYLSEYTGVAGILFVDKSDTSKRVFFPFTGYAFEESHSDGGTYGHYWSSSPSTSTGSLANTMYFGSVYIILPQGKLNYYGYPIRPVAD